jgi:hypothetical protein
MIYPFNMFDYPYYTKDGINKGLDYKCKPNEVGTLDSANKRFIITTIPPADDTIVKKTLITFKGNYRGADTYIDYATGRSYVDNCKANGVVFTGTDKELSAYADKLINDGYNIQDFYNYEKNDK